MRTKIENFLRELETEIDVFYLVDIDSIDFNNAFDSIVNMIEETNGFDIEIFYYGNAMKYLMENDPSLQESLGIASDYGFDVQSLNSEILASILASKNVKEEFNELESEINDFFAELEDEDEDEDEWLDPYNILADYENWLTK